VSDYHFPTLTACVIFHNEWIEVEECIVSFKRYYPNETVILARDTLPPIIPNEFEKYKCVIIPRNNAMNYLILLNSLGKSINELNLQQRLHIINLQVNKLSSISKKCKTEFVLFLEYDSLVRRKIPVYSDTDIEILEANKFTNFFLKKINRVSTRPVNFSGWGFVTGTIRVQALKEAILWYQNNQTIISQITQIESQMVVLDFLLPVLIHLSGGKVKSHNLTIECSRDKLWRLRKAPLLHQYRGKHRNFRSCIRRSLIRG
jgi:hypothetical protein